VCSFCDARRDDGILFLIFFGGSSIHSPFTLFGTGGKTH
jgi:hypothetical protein